MKHPHSHLWLWLIGITIVLFGILFWPEVAMFKTL